MSKDKDRWFLTSVKIKLQVFRNFSRWLQYFLALRGPFKKNSQMFCFLSEIWSLLKYLVFIVIRMLKANFCYMQSLLILVFGTIKSNKFRGKTVSIESFLWVVFSKDKMPFTIFGLLWLLFRLTSQIFN